MWHLTACKFLDSLSILKRKDILSYLWINVANINSEYDKNVISFLIHFKHEKSVNMQCLLDTPRTSKGNSLYKV